MPHQPAPQQRAAVVAQAATWLGTPYHHHGRIKGAGVDCAMLLAEVYQACGLVPPLEPGHYPHDWHLHRSQELFLAWVRHAGARQVQAPDVGDVGLWHYGRTWSHGSIVVAAGPVPMLVHAYIGLGVVRTAADEAPLAGRDVQWYSLWDAA